VSECPLPLGTVVFDHVLEPVAGGCVRVVKKVAVQGGIGPLLRLFAPRCAAIPPSPWPPWDGGYPHSAPQPRRVRGGSPAKRQDPRLA
jgi:hypothetical protein